MKIAVPVNDRSIEKRFELSETFDVYEIDGGIVKSIDSYGRNGLTVKEVIQALGEVGVSACILDEISLSARMALDEENITIYAGIVGFADDAITHFLNGTFPYQDALLIAPR